MQHRRGSSRQGVPLPSQGVYPLGRATNRRQAYAGASSTAQALQRPYRAIPELSHAPTTDHHRRPARRQALQTLDTSSAPRRRQRTRFSSQLSALSSTLTPRRHATRRVTRPPTPQTVKPPPRQGRPDGERLDGRHAGDIRTSTREQYLGQHSARKVHHTTQSTPQLIEQATYPRAYRLCRPPPRQARTYAPRRR